MHKKHILVLCGRNKKRSLTAEAVFQNHPTIAVRSAGVSAAARRVVSQKDIAWADEIWCMEQKHADKVRQLFSEVPNIEVLDIPDIYEYMSEELIEIFVELGKS